jgi:hypothetical protein
MFQNIEENVKEYMTCSALTTVESFSKLENKG